MNKNNVDINNNNINIDSYSNTDTDTDIVTVTDTDTDTDMKKKINKYIYTNSNIIFKLLKLIISKANKKKKENICECCGKKFKYIYIYKYKNLSIKIYDSDKHILQSHNMINSNLYKQLMFFKLAKYKIEWYLISTNQLNIINGLYEIGSNQIYIERNKNISQSKITRFSEHAGFIYFSQNKVSNINIISGSRIDSKDPTIYMPKNSLEALKVNYIFHTHPKTPYLGSRIKNGLVYEFPSIHDIIHFIEHHNNGKLLGSIVVAPEGLYIIRKNNFNRENIYVDYDIMITDLEEIFLYCYNESFVEFSPIDYQKHKINKEIKLSEDFFYNKISTNYTYINKINEVLIKYDLFIDYYARIFFDENNFTSHKWIFDDIYVPYVN